MCPDGAAFVNIEVKRMIKMVMRLNELHLDPWRKRGFEGLMIENEQYHTGIMRKVLRMDWSQSNDVEHIRRELEVGFAPRS